MLTYIFGIITGVAQPTQTSINSALRMRLRSPYLASIVSFVTAALGICVLVMCISHNLSIPFADIAKEPWWIWTGGLCGDVIVLMCILCLPKLGSVETVILTVLGQITAGLAVDHFGLFHSNVVRLTGLRALGAALVILGVVIVSTKLGNKAKAIEPDEAPKLSGGKKLLFRAAALSVGVASGLQIGINGRLGAVVGSSLKAALLSMCVGTVGIVLVTVAIWLVKGRAGVIDESLPVIEGKWWMWIGGFAGILIVGGCILVAQILGPGIAAILNIVGQTAGGVIIDATGFLGIEKKPITLSKIIGILIMIAGTVLVQIM